MLFRYGFNNTLEEQLLHTLQVVIGLAVESQKPLELKHLQELVTKSRSDIQRYLSIGWIGVCEKLAESDQDMGDLMDLWHKFHLFLRLLLHVCLKLERMLVSLGFVYLLSLFLSLSEFSGRLRPPCTTMPWMISPALVVLWGVCWMFYEELSRDWVVEDGSLAAGYTAGLYEDIGLLDQGDQTLLPLI
jgi:hypothetical protein